MPLLFDHYRPTNLSKTNGMRSNGFCMQPAETVTPPDLRISEQEEVPKDEEGRKKYTKVTEESSPTGSRP